MNLFTGEILTPTLAHYLILSLILFAGGTFVLISNENLIKSLLGLAVMFNAALLGFVSANSFLNEGNSISSAIEAPKSVLVSSFASLENVVQTFNLPYGDLTGLFIIILGTIELGIGAVIIYAVYSKFKTLDIKALTVLKSDENKTEGEF